MRATSSRSSTSRVSWLIWRPESVAQVSLGSSGAIWRITSTAVGRRQGCAARAKHRQNSSLRFDACSCAIDLAPLLDLDLEARYRRAVASAAAERAASSSTGSESPAKAQRASAPTARRDEIKGRSNESDAPAAGATAPAKVLRHDSASSCPSSGAARWTIRSAPPAAASQSNTSAGSPDSSPSAPDARGPHSGTSNCKLTRGGVGIERCAERWLACDRKLERFVFASATDAAGRRRSRAAPRQGGAAFAASSAGGRTP